jgi:HD-GYP domain-containing protein (c-di-GMP phosphodiesterase class II)
MIKIEVSDLKEGMKFTQPVYVDEQNLLVPEDIEIRQKDIDRLTKWGIETVQTEGNVVSEESLLGNAAMKVVNILDQKGNPEQLPLYRTSVMQMDRILGEIKANRAVDKKEIDNIIEKLTRESLNASDEMTAFVFRNDKAELSFGRSAVNCVILSVIVGASVKMDQKRMKILASAAALHDVGMLRIPDDIIEKKSNLTNEDIKRIRTHPLHAYQIIFKELEYQEEIALIALQHHERWDGKGYPRKLSGKNIAVEARIVSVVDAFDAMVKEKPYRSSMIGYNAMRQLLNDNSRRFDSEILKVFIKSMGIYPIGSFTLLNNGSIGRVVKIQRQAPLRPIIKLLVDQQGTKYLKEDGPVVDLAKEKEAFIARAIDPHAVGMKKKI